MEREFFKKKTCNDFNISLYDVKSGMVMKESTCKYTFVYLNVHVHIYEDTFDCSS